MSAIECRPATESQMDAHCSVCPGDAPLAALIVLTFGVGPNGSMSVRLCEDHAHSTINALGFVYCSTTGTSVSKLLGVRERRTPPPRTAKRKSTR